MNNSLDNRTKNLDEIIADAENKISKQKIKIERAELSLLNDERKLHELKCQRDLRLLANMKGSPDWKLIFSFDPDETSVMYQHREEVLDSIGLKRTGHYNPTTRQHSFSIEFETDTPLELHEKIAHVEFIFKNLVFDPTNNMKFIVVDNMRDNIDCIWEIKLSGLNNNYYLIKTSFYTEKESHTFTCLNSIMSKIQALSNVAFDSYDQNLIN